MEHLLRASSSQSPSWPCLWGDNRWPPFSTRKLSVYELQLAVDINGAAVDDNALLFGLGEKQENELGKAWVEWYDDDVRQTSHPVNVTEPSLALYTLHPNAQDMKIANRYWMKDMRAEIRNHSHFNVRVKSNACDASSLLMGSDKPASASRIISKNH